MNNSVYGVEQYVDDLRSIVRKQTDPQRIVAAVRPFAMKLASTPHWVKEEFWGCNEEQGFGIHLLHEEDNHDLAVFVISWLPDRGTLAHNHKTWAVVVGMHGDEKETEWRRMDDGKRPGYAKLRRVGERVMRAGDVSSCMPDDIHTVWNVGTEKSMSLHTYGRHINFTGRSEFEPDKNEERPLVVTVEKGKES
jgi:predicted metal-dependent enzyme (double-stranded beta helix superfamily)